MKNTTVILQGKKILAILFFGIAVLATNKSSAQRIAPAKEIAMFNLTEEKDSKIEQYAVKTSNGNAYLQWHVKEERKGGIFLVQRSQNMMDFKIIGIREDFSTDAFITLMFCFTDKNPLPGISYYRIIKVYEDGSYYYSDIETVEFETQPKENNKVLGASRMEELFEKDFSPGRKSFF